MNSHWFKFYGQDWLTDLKVVKLSSVDRLCYITLLCLASTTDDAIIKKCDEEALIELTHLYNNPYDNEDNDYVRAKGCLQRFNDNGMITLDNIGNISINNFLKRQGSNLTGYERVKKYREKHKEKNEDKLKDRKIVINDNVMITSDKIREDKRREDIYSEQPEVASQVQEIFKIFYQFNKTINFGNKTQRSILAKLIKQLSFDKVKSAVEFIATHREDQYCPNITTPIELQNKWSKLELYATKQ